MKINSLTTGNNFLGRINQTVYIDFRHLWYIVVLVAVLSIVAIVTFASSGVARDLAKIYWLSSTGKIHNSSCIYYAVGDGKFVHAPQGADCRKCGGQIKKR